MSTRAVAPVKAALAPRALSHAPGALLQRKCACGGSASQEGECEECKKKKLQRRAAGPGPAVAPPIVHEVLRSSGQPLDAVTRSFFEPRFGHDFSRVRVHTNGRASESAVAINALAYTVGNKIVFGSGQYSPHTTVGKKLIAHELAHSLQQQNASASENNLAISRSSDPLEVEAESAAAAVLKGGHVPGLRPGNTQVHRQTGKTEEEKKKLEELKRELQNLAGGPKGPSAEGEEERAERERKEKLVESAKSTPFGRTLGSSAKSTWGWGSPETDNLYQECKVVGMERAQFLDFVSALPRPPSPPKRRDPAAVPIILGATQLRGKVVPPEIAATAVPGGFKLKPTHAEMPAVYSAFTKSNSAGFNEGTRQCLNADCQSTVRQQGTPKLPIHWTITPGGAQKLEAGEREHCEDQRESFNLTLALYASVINNLAAKERVYSSERQAINDAISLVGVQPSDMVDRFIEMAEKTRGRDDLGWHSANDTFPKGNFHSQNCTLENGCRALEIIDENSLPAIGMHAFSELTTPAATAKPRGKP